MAPSPTKRMGTSELQTTLSCECGRSVVARATDAAGAVVCECGRSVAVPALSKLRALAGADAFVTNPAEAIRKLQAQGINPAGERCLLCGSTSPRLYVCCAICESSYVNRMDSAGANSVPGILLALMSFPHFLHMIFEARQAPSPPQVHGHDVEVSFTLPVCGPCASSYGDPSRPKMARRLMAKVPVLAELLDYYPRLKLDIARPSS
jgi:hypothetical protein